jgi:hypothetical protein
MTHKTLRVLIYGQAPKNQGAILVKLKTTNSSMVWRLQMVTFRLLQDGSLQMLTFYFFAFYCKLFNGFYFSWTYIQRLGS